MANAEGSTDFKKDGDGKVALITGGTRGMGFATAKALAESGHHLVLGYRSDDETAQQATKTIQNDYGKTVVCVKGDTKDKDTVEKYFQAIKEHFNNHLTVVIHHAGAYVNNEKTAQDADDRYWLKWSDVYYKMYASCFGHLIQKALECTGLKHIIATSSPGCNITYNPLINYELMGVGKSAMEFLVRVNAKKLGPRGITVNCVIPGIVPSKEWKKLIKMLFHKEVSYDEVGGICSTMAANYPLQRCGKPEDIANTVAFLCSEKGSFITGVCLPVDGGFHLGALQSSGN